MLKKLDKTNFYQEVSNNTTYSVVLFIIKTHKKSMEIFDLLRSLAKGFNPQLIQFCYVDIDSETEISEKNSIREIPYLILYDASGIPIRMLAPNNSSRLLIDLLGESLYEAINPYNI